MLGILQKIRLHKLDFRDRVIMPAVAMIAVAVAITVSICFIFVEYC